MILLLITSLYTVQCRTHGIACILHIYVNVIRFLITGNGPSAISLSFMLSGNAPYYLGGASDEHLHTRLKSNPNETILLQDLEELATVRDRETAMMMHAFTAQPKLAIVQKENRYNGGLPRNFPCASSMRHAEGRAAGKTHSPINFRHVQVFCRETIIFSPAS